MLIQNQDIKETTNNTNKARNTTQHPETINKILAISLYFSRMMSPMARQTAPKKNTPLKIPKMRLTSKIPMKAIRIPFFLFIVWKKDRRSIFFCLCDIDTGFVFVSSDIAAKSHVFFAIPEFEFLFTIPQTHTNPE